MKNRKGFTLIELMVVILIVAILAAVAIPIMRGRIEAAKWTEGKAMAGTIATALRADAAEQGVDAAYTTPASGDVTALGFIVNDFAGTYFRNTNFSWSSTNTTTSGFQYIITITPGIGMTVGNVTLTDGIWAP